MNEKYAVDQWETDGGAIQHARNDACPECGAYLKMVWSGVKCIKCSYWFCY